MGEPYYTPAGRDMLFHPNDIARIESTMREELKCPSPSDRRVKAKRRTTKSAAPISESEWKLAADLTNDPSLLPSCEKSRSASRHMGNIPRPSLKLIQGSRPS